MSFHIRIHQKLSIIFLLSAFMEIFLSKHGLSLIEENEGLKGRGSLQKLANFFTSG